RAAGFTAVSPQDRREIAVAPGGQPRNPVPGNARPVEGEPGDDQARSRRRRSGVAARADAIGMSRLGLNAPNLITLSRLLSVPLMIWLIVYAQFAAAFWVFVAAGASDALDGFIAKR